MNNELLLVAVGSMGIVLFIWWIIHIININIVTGAWIFGITTGLFIHIGSGAIACLIKDTKWFKSSKENEKNEKMV